MNKNLITITIDNYKGKKLTFTAPADATVNLLKTKSVSGKNKGKFIETSINFKYFNGIEIKEEDLQV